MIKIGDFSKMAKVTIKALRYYDEIGLLKPSYIDRDTSYRYYETTQLTELSKIVLLRQIGVPIEDIIRYKKGTSLEEILKERRTAAIQNLENSKKQLLHIDYLLKEKEKIMDYQAIIKNVPECVVYFRQGIIKNFSEITSFIVDAEREVRENNPDIKIVEPNYCYIIYLDEEFYPKNMLIEYAEAVVKEGVASKNVQFKTVPETKVVSLLHKGSYNGLTDAYAYITKWIRENGYTIIDRPRERYIDGHWNNKKEEDWLTEIQFPIAK
ncbi:MAG: MerR family transcriptional regulator [Bacilli bacterium]|nr:MerR family transcriptional regulator [Bacilli bacterium]